MADRESGEVTPSIADKYFAILSAAKNGTPPSELAFQNPNLNLSVFECLCIIQMQMRFIRSLPYDVIYEHVDGMLSMRAQLPSEASRSEMDDYISQLAGCPSEVKFSRTELEAIEAQAVACIFGGGRQLGRRQQDALTRARAKVNKFLNRKETHLRKRKKA